MIEPLMVAALAADDFRRILGNDLTGVYVCGSLAFGSSPHGSTDIDLFVAVERELSQAEKESMLRVVMEREKDAPGKGINLTVIRADVCRNYEHPGAYMMRYSMKNRFEAGRDPAGFCARMKGMDPVLAVHLTVCRTTGFCVIGMPAQQLVAGVTEADFIDGVRALLDETDGEIRRAPAETVLELCRCLAFAEGGCIASRSQGGRWALTVLTGRWQALVHEALLAYWAEETMEIPEDLDAFAAYMKERVSDALDRRLSGEGAEETGGPDGKAG